MRSDNSLPSYQKLFGDLDFVQVDESRSVYSPAAYLAELLQLLADHPSTSELMQRRPDLDDIPLDAANSYTELPYLDVVNEVLAKQIPGQTADSDAFDVLSTMQHPFDVPYSLRHERLRTYLRHLDVDPVELYRQFAPTVNPDTIAREQLGLTPEETALVTTVLGDGPELRACYRLDPDADDPFHALEEVDRFRLATSMTGAELRTLLYGDLSAAGSPAERSEAAALFVHHGGEPVTLDAEEKRLVSGVDAGHVPAEWFDRVNRFVRLARRTGLSFTDLDLVLRIGCGNRIDNAALRTLAVLTRLGRDLDLPLDVVVSLVGPMNTLGVGDEETPRDLFNRVFNAPFVAVDRSVVRASAYIPAAYAGLPELAWTGELLGLANSEYRRRIAAALGIPGNVMVDIVERYRGRPAGDAPGPFDRGAPTLPALSLLHRITRLATALEISVNELFSVLDALERDPTIQRYSGLPVLIDSDVQGTDYYAVLAGGDVDSGLWLVQTLVAVVRWLQANDLTGQELIDIIGGGPTEPRAQANADEQHQALRESLLERVEAVRLTPDLFLSERFGPRAAQVVSDVISGFGEGVTSARDERLLRVDPAVAASAGYAAVAELSTVASDDFLGLGLDERFTAKIFANLVFAGYLDAAGGVVADRLPSRAEELRLAGDFSAYQQALFDMIAGYATDEGGSFYPSDLRLLADELTEGIVDADQAELYDNLIFNGYLDPDGTILKPDFFAAPESAAVFAVNADLGDVSADVHARLLAQAARFTREPIFLDPAIFAGLGLPERQLADLMESLRFNGYLDRDDRYLDPAAVLALLPGDLNLALEFYPLRRSVLDAMQAQLSQAKWELSTLVPEDVREIADGMVAQRVIGLLDGVHLREGRLTEEGVAFLDDPANALVLEGLTTAECATVTHQLQTIQQDRRPYRLDLAAVDALGFSPEERDQLVASLVAAGDLTADLTVAEDRLAFFGYVHHALDFTLPGLEDFSWDIFFLLYSAATEMATAVADVAALVTARAAEQQAALSAVLQDAFGVAAPTIEAICAAVVGSITDAVELFTAPTPDGTLATADPDVRRAVRRIRGFALLAAKLNLSDTEVATAYHDQDLTGKFPEPLALPPGVDVIDALLERSDGTVYLFRERSYWIYAANTHALVDPQPKPLAELSARFGDLAGVDAAFTDAAGTEWVVGRDTMGISRTFIRERGRSHFLPKHQAWGKVRNVFDDAPRIDAAFVDEQGRAYLFCGDQYVRYSGPDYREVDEGYPRGIGEWWEGDALQSQVPPRFRASLDAAFRGLDGRTYLFAGDRFIALGGRADEPDQLQVAEGEGEGDAAEQRVESDEVAEVWGRVANALAGAEQVDAAYVAGSALLVFAGNQVFSYLDSIENDGVCMAAGYPKRIESQFGDVPVEFEGGVEAAFVDPAGVVHLFKNGRTAALRPEGPSVAPTAERWGRLGPVLPSGTVDSAMVGLDGRTYLFSGDQYLRYSGSDYSAVDIGYPRTIAGDWGGLRQVDAAFVMDGATYLFGDGALLFDLPPTLPADHAADLETGRLPRQLRQRLADHGVTVAVDAVVFDTDFGWQLTADRNLRITLRRSSNKIEVRCEDAPCYVRYSTRNYATPDPGHPRPMTDNWWNLPDTLVSGEGAPFAQVDEVLTGRDGRTYLFSGDQFIVFDNKRRWWSEPSRIREHWDSLPFDRVDAAFVSVDDKTYVFSGSRYVRYSGTYTRVDDRYPAPITPFWANVVNNIARTGRVDAALVVDDHTYLFSGNQFVRYTGNDFSDVESSRVDDGYPRRLAALAQEPRFAGLATALTSVDAAFADRGTIYLFSGRQIHAVSAAAYRRYDALAADSVGCAFMDDGAVHVEHSDGWHRYGALEGLALTAPAVRPRALRAVPPEFQTGLDAVLRAVDGTTYLFKDASCYNTRLGREYPLAEEWGRPRNNVYHDNAVDAAFVGVDGKTYVFSGDQFVTYSGPNCMDADIDGAPRSVAEHWAGLSSVALGYVRDGTTFLFEPADSSGSFRYVAYSGKDYGQPDEGYPKQADADFFSIPHDYRPAGSTLPDAVLFTGDTMLLLIGGTYLQHDETTDTWLYPRPLERIWRGVGPMDGFSTAFTGRDGATYVFFAHEFTRMSGGTFSARQPIRDHWGRSRNNFLAAAGDVVDAAFVHRGEVTYLFAGDQYVRYSTPDCRYVDAGYPKPIVGNLRSEEPFRNLPASFDEELAERVANGSRSMVDAVVANRRNVHVFVDRTCHVVSAAATATYDLGILGRVRNTIAGRRRVDAALVSGEHTYLFSADQYVRYTGGTYGFVDDGYPRPIADGLAAELGIAELPPEFHDGIDAAFRAPDGRAYLFAGSRYLEIDSGGSAVGRVAGTWGRVHNEFAVDSLGPHLEAAFVTATGELYAFAGGQYVRYGAGAFDTVEEGFPLRIRDNWGDLPPTFEEKIDGAFRLHGRTYLVKGNEYVRYSGDRFDAVDRTYPQPFSYRWADASDYRIGDIRAITRFTALTRTHPELEGFLLSGPATVADPYQLLATVFGWDVEELKWCRRHSRFLSGGADDEERLELEFLLELVDLFALTGKLGTGPSRVFGEVWSRLYASTDQNIDLDSAAAVLRELLARKAGPVDWPVLSRQIHDELNLSKRAALVPAVVAELGLETSRDLFDRFLVDVDMGSRGITSRVREALAATQLYIHRYLLNLESTDGDEAARQRVKTWWTWMRNYRVWEANRKVFLYPENYIRPELRIAKTPAFAALESDLLQGEITPTSVERAYKRYLDEYTEVSRLTIAGGYVYAKDQNPAGPRRLVLFGRTKTDPRRYYYRRAEFGSREKLSANWEPWLPVDVQIDADLVHPVHAFGRVFVFWAVTEPVSTDDPTSTTVVARTEGAEERFSAAKAPTQRVKIMYSFYNLNNEWVPAQTLGTGTKEAGTISGITLLVRPRIKDDGKMSIVVSCSYAVTDSPAPGAATTPPSTPTTRPAAVLFDLNPELYAEDPLDLTTSSDPAGAAVAIATYLEEAAAAAMTSGRVARIFVDPVNPVDVVRFDAPAGAESWPWFSVDHKGGSFLCRPVSVDETEDAPRLPLAGNKDRLPEWSRVDAAVELPGGVRVFFDNGRHQYLQQVNKSRAKLGTPEATGTRWGKVRTVLAQPGDVDAVLTRGDQTFVFSGRRYVRFTGTPFGSIDTGYPKNLQGNDEKLPQWPKVDVAFTGVDGVEYFYSNQRNEVVTSEAMDAPLPLEEYRRRFGLPEDFGPTVTVMVTDAHTFLLSGDKYARFSQGSIRRGRRAERGKDKEKDKETAWYDAVDAGYPRPIQGNPDGIPTDFAISEAMWRQGTAYYFDNASGTYLTVAPDGTRTVRPTCVRSAIAEKQSVDAAWVAGDRLYLTLGAEYVRYTLADGSPGEFADDGYPKRMPRPLDAAFRREDQVYLFTRDRYTRIDAGSEPVDLPDLRPVAGAWAELPRDAVPPFDAAMDSETGLFLFVGDGYHRYKKSGAVPRPYELQSLPFEIIRLTTGTASELNRTLLSGGVRALLDLATQETDELAVSTDPDAVGAVRVRASMVDAGRLPSGSHLDFRSANGIYYWEIFFHAPFLIAQALNSAQRFEDARQWYEYIFDPTTLRSYWRFLPFLAVDPAALADSLTADVARLGAVGLAVDAVDDVTAAVATVITALRDLTPAFAQNREPATEAELAAATTLTSAETHKTVATAVKALGAGSDAAQGGAIAGLRERTLMAADLEKLFDALGDRDNLLKAYRDNPFDPHAIAELRPVAYRRAVVMGYVDNLLDWGDLLFQQYTPESVDQARMLYVLAWDLLGARPERLGTRLLPSVESFASLGLDAAPGELDLLGFFTSGGALTEGGGAVHAGIANAYFFIPENSLFAEYWDRITDRLYKIRESLNILGIAAPLPLFAPPIDPMALVRATAAGADLDSVTADATAPVPHYRFSTMYRKAQELVDKVTSYGSELLSVLERGSAEELSLLQNRQEQAILAMTVAIKEAQVRIAEENLDELTASQEGAQARASHYQSLIDTGMTAQERAQVGMMGAAAGLHIAASVLKIAAGIAYVVPQYKAGPFIIGVEHGGRNLGDSLDKGGEFAESLGEGFSMIGEVLGIQAQHERMTQDWELQLSTARNDLVQITHRLEGARQQVAVARREADIHARQIEHNESVATFLKDKFANAELYGWMAGRLSGLYFSAYRLAYETAKAAERAYQFEHGTSETLIRPGYWESRRNGLLAGASLSLDLERLGKAHLDGDGRGLEITKQISLLDLDPIAMLRLRETGTCEFALTEALFDEDFPGQYRRQLRTVTVTFADAEGNVLGMNATLTQLAHKTVLEADPKAVKHLLDPKGPAPESVRSDWRASQQIALSQPDGGRDNNGLFELRFDDDRYLPFEGTGAVSTWRLERGLAADPALYDVWLTVKYTADNGGEIFADAVKGMLKPRLAARFFDLARDFPEEWAEFTANGSETLELRLTPEMFPGMASSQITGIVPAYELTEGSAAHLLLNGDPKLTLEEGKLLPTPGLTVRNGAAANWVFTVAGDKEHLRDVDLVLTYQAR